jgi:hypothetical protein
MAMRTKFPHHIQRSVVLRERAYPVFEHLDDFERLGAYMMRSSRMMAGSRLRYEFDSKQGRALNGLVKLRGSFLGIALAIDEEIIERVPPLAPRRRPLHRPIRHRWLPRPGRRSGCCCREIVEFAGTASVGIARSIAAVTVGSRTIDGFHGRRRK